MYVSSERARRSGEALFGDINVIHQLFWESASLAAGAGIQHSPMRSKRNVLPMRRNKRKHPSMGDIVPVIVGLINARKKIVESTYLLRVNMLAFSRPHRIISGY